MISDQAQFCIFCGSSIVRDVNTANTPQHTASLPGRSNRNFAVVS
jgi:hypothetical protein